MLMSQRRRNGFVLLEDMAVLMSAWRRSEADGKKMCLGDDPAPGDSFPGFAFCVRNGSPEYKSMCGR